MNAARRLLSKLRRRFPRAARLSGWLRPRVLWRRLRLMGKDTEGIFTYIYEKRVWDASESISGAGSSLKATASIREELPNVFATMGIRSLLDAPCGDYHWMKEVDLDLDLYIGGDIVRPLIATLNERYGSDAHRFIHLDIIRDPLPDADAFLCRDCLLHLSNEDVLRALENAVRSPCRYLLASTYPDCERNTDIPTGMARPLNLCRPPFDLPEPIRILADPSVHVDEKCLALWDLDRIRAQRATTAGGKIS